MKKITVCLIMLAIVLSGCGNSNQGPKELSEVKIGVIQFAQHPALDAAYEGFKEVLIEAGVDEKNIDHQIASGEFANCETIADKLVNDGNDLIYAIATDAAQATANKTTDIPIVISAVTDPKSAGLVDSNEEPGTNVTGASDLTPISNQMELLKEILPDAKKIAIMYCSSEDNSEFQAKIAEEEAKKNNLDYVLKTVSDSNDIQAVTNAIVGDKNIDAIYIPTDNLLAEYMSTVSQIATAANIPCIVGEKGMVTNGGLATYGIDYLHLGQLAGEQALTILKGEKTPSEMPIAYLSSDECELVINLEVAKECSIKIDKADFKNANFIE